MATVPPFTGAFTPLRTPLAPLEDTVAQQASSPNLRNLADVDFETVPQEITDIISNLAASIGSSLGANRRISFWVACIMLEKWCLALRHDGVAKRAQ